MMKSARTRTSPCPRTQTVPIRCHLLHDDLAMFSGRAGPGARLVTPGAQGRDGSSDQQSFEPGHGGLKRLDAGGEPPVLVVQGVEGLVVEQVPGVEQLPGRRRSGRLSILAGAHQRLAGTRATPPYRSTTCRTIASGRHSLTGTTAGRSEEHTSELQSRQYLVCRLLLEKKKI